jgi:P4 family phage/plasmid primase-like protien
MQITVPKMQDKIKEYLGFGLSVVPCNDLKVPCAKWKHLQTNLASESEVSGWPKAPMIALICGAVSGGLQVVDVDCKYDLSGKLWSQLNDAVDEVIPDLMNRFLIQKTVSGGYHLIYRCSHIGRNEKLANRETLPEERKDPKDLIRVLLETRGEGGYFCVYPSKGYEIIQGDFSEIPEITSEEQEILLEVCRTFNQIEAEVKPSLPPTQDLTPFDDYDQRGDFLGLLQSHGWPLLRQDGAISLFTRPGKTKGVSAAFNAPNAKGLPNRFNVFSTSTVFQTGTLYKPYAVYALLEHGGDYKAACKKLGEEGFGNKKPEKKQKIVENQQVVLDKDYDPCDIAKRFLVGKYIRWNNDAFYRYNGSGYDELDSSVIEKQLSSFLSDFLIAKTAKNIVPFRKTKAALADILYNIQLETLSTAPLPSFNGNPAPNLICLQNGIFDTKKRALESSTPDFFTTNNLGFCYDVNAVCPKWEAFVKSQCSNPALLQEWFGLNLVNDTSYQKVFFMLGLPRTGKSTALNVLKLLVGEKNYVTSTFTALENDFGLSPFIGKLSAIFPDAHFSQSGRKDPVAVIETIKSISGEDDVLVNRKNKKLLSLKLKVRLTFACNTIPRLNDETRAISERLLALTFGPVIEESKRNIALLSELQAELSGILNWALIGLYRLRDKGFCKTDADLKADFEKTGNPFLVWVEECLVFAESGRIERKQAFESYVQWCDENRHQASSSTSFYAKILTLHKIVQVKVMGKFYFKGASL